MDNYDMDIQIMVEKEEKKFFELFHEAITIFSEKNIEYGDAIRETGVIGSVTEIVGCSARLKRLVLRSKDHGRSNISSLRKNILMDVLIYSLITLMWLDEENWEGEL